MVSVPRVKEPFESSKVEYSYHGTLRIRIVVVQLESHYCLAYSFEANRGSATLLRPQSRYGRAVVSARRPFAPLLSSQQVNNKDLNKQQCRLTAADV